MKRIAYILAILPSALTSPASAASKAPAPVLSLSPSRAATHVTKQSHLAGEWRGFPAWSLALGAAILSAGIVVAVFNTDPTDDLPDSN